MNGLPKIGLLGGGPVALECMRLLYERHDQSACSFIGYHASHPIPIDNDLIDRFAMKYGVKCFSDPLELLATPDLALCFSIGNGWLIPEDMVDQPDQGIINFHAGPLPEYKGSAVPAFAIINGATDFGITFHKVTAALDAGPIIHREMFPIDDTMTAKEIDQECIETGIRCLGRMIGAFISGDYTEVPQPQGTKPYKRRSMETCRKLDLNWSDRKMWAHIRACDWDGVLKPAFVEIGGQKVFLTARMRGTYVS